MLKKILNVVLSRVFMFAFLAVFQIGLLIFLVYQFAKAGAIAYITLSLVTVIVILVVVEQEDMNPAYRMMWLFLVAILPFSGALFYLLWGHRHMPRRQRRRFDEVDKRADGALEQDQAVMEALGQQDAISHGSATYLLEWNHSPVYAGNRVEYYPIGRDFYPPFLESLRKAEKYIFLQYFIVQEDSTMLEEILEILQQKAAAGVDVRLIWDGFGSLFTLTQDFAQRLEASGIKGRVFSPLKATIHLSDYAMLNHRDHRKIAVVDGTVAFSGGLNIADEYINRIERFGEWKDTSFRIEGCAAFSFTVTFLRTWDYVTGDMSEFSWYQPGCREVDPEEMNLGQGYVQPYWDSPLDAETVSVNTYLNVIRHATHYLYISTPYLILDYEMNSALTLAAKSGVDVRILTPGIPDKPTIYTLSRSYYPALLRGGVRIYEYTPGFNHAKLFVSDDRVAIVGSVNMDYRSLYLHFENGASFYGGEIVGQTKADMLECFDKSKEILLEDTKNVSLGVRALRIAARVVSPLL